MKGQDEIMSAPMTAGVPGTMIGPVRLFAKTARAAIGRAATIEYKRVTRSITYIHAATARSRIGRLAGDDKHYWASVIAELTSIVTVSSQFDVKCNG